MAHVCECESWEEGEGQGLGWAPGFGVILTSSCCVVPKSSPSTHQDPCAPSSGIRPGPISQLLSILLSIPPLGCIPDHPGLGRPPRSGSPCSCLAGRAGKNPASRHFINNLPTCGCRWGGAGGLRVEMEPLAVPGFLGDGVARAGGQAMAWESQSSLPATRDALRMLSGPSGRLFFQES